ncbi:MAG: hypothetical protein WCF88_01660 [Candidatus Acidiferrales bacterium]|jgi:hypothetical protein
MRHKAKLFAMAGMAMILLLAGAGVRAQDAASAPPPPPPPGHGYGHGPGGRDEIRFLGFEAGLGDKTVTGAPFSASFSTETTETLADGNQIKHTSTGTIARDSQGRTRRDMTLPAFGATAAAGQAAPHVTFVNDPVAGTRYILEADTKTARQMPPPPDKAEFARKGHTGAAAADKDVVTTSLGTQTIGGVTAEGTRYTRTIPAGQIGNVKPIVITTERWYSADLQMVVMTKRSDPRSGDTTFQMTNIARTEPAASLFQVPTDYTVAQMNPHVRGAARMSGPPPPPEE